MTYDPRKSIWPATLSIRDTQLFDDLGGAGQRIYTTAGQGYEKQEYIRGDLYETVVGQLERLRADWYSPEHMDAVQERTIGPLQDEIERLNELLRART